MVEQGAVAGESSHPVPRRTVPFHPAPRSHGKTRGKTAPLRLFFPSQDKQLTTFGRMAMSYNNVARRVLEVPHR